jgi:acetyltransferase
LRLTPIDAAEAQAMLSETRARRALSGWRGAPACDVRAVIDAIVRLAQVLVDEPRIAEIDMNPVLVMREGEGLRVADVRIHLEERA